MYLCKSRKYCSEKRFVVYGCETFRVLGVSGWCLLAFRFLEELLFGCVARRRYCSATWVPCLFCFIIKFDELTSHAGLGLLALVYKRKVSFDILLHIAWILNRQAFLAI